jgi:hypothetical protein
MIKMPGHARARTVGYVFELELWVRPQPAGIRVRDAVAWAREILQRYEGDLDGSNNAQAHG